MCLLLTTLPLPSLEGVFFPFSKDAMATTLDVVNECLGSMGEAPLNTLTEPHSFKASALKQLSKANERIQSTGWWFNTEAMTFTPAPATGQIQLSGDTLKWTSGVRTADTLTRSRPMPWLVKRGSRLYDTRLHTYVITEDVTGELVRLIPFEDLPTVVAAHITAEAVLKFQSLYDADNSRRTELQEAWRMTRMDANSENIRQLGVNMINNNVRLQRIKSVTRRLRY